MRKRITGQAAKEKSPSGQEWLSVENLAQVEVSSEDPAHPIESALVPGKTGSWRAAESGGQTIRLLFDKPQQLRRISLVFEETERERTQEFLLRWSPDNDSTYREIVRQQWNFSPPGTVEETEDYRVELAGVTVLELKIIPNMGGGDARASLKQMRLA